MDRILVFTPPEDQARRAVSLAAELAGRSGASLTLLRVLAEDVRAPARSRDGRSDKQLRGLLRDAEQGELEAIAAPLRERGLRVDVDVDVAWGVPWEVILDRVGTADADLVVKPAHGVTHSGRVFFGSTALHLFRRCPCPVWVVGDDGRLPRRIIAAVDPAKDRTRREVAHRILGWAHRVSGWTDATLHVASAWHAPAAELLAGRIPDEEIAAYVEDAAQRAREALDEILQQSATFPTRDRVHLLEGPARDVLPGFVEEHDVDLIVMGTLGRTGPAGDLLGETAEMIVRAVRSSVLTVAPPAAVRLAEGFEPD